MSVIHFHYSILPDTGDTRRVRNIDKSLCDKLSDEKIEVLFYGTSLRKLFKNTTPFTLSENTKRKYCFQMVYRFHWLGELTSALQLAYVTRKHRAEYVVGEFGSSSRTLKLFRYLHPHVKIIVDFHGAQPEEMAYEGMKTSLCDYYASLEKLSCSISDGIVCQSEEMKCHIINKYNADGNKIFVFKCGVNTNMFRILEAEERRSIRDNLGLSNDDTVFIYSGSVSKWQKVDLSLKFFAAYHINNPKSKLIILTRNVEMVKSLIGELNLDSISESVISKSVPYEQVNMYLNVADIAFLLRDDDLLNAVASPTKLAEYLACGLPIITSSVSEKWISKNILEKMVLWKESDNDINELIDNALSVINKSLFRQYAVDNLSVEIDEVNIDRMVRSIKNL